MRRSDFYIKLTTAVLFLAVVSYIGFYIYDAARNTYLTVSALSCTIEETAAAHGYIVREETVLKGTAGTVMPVAAEGEKVSVGQVVAVGYSGGGALEAAGEIRELRLRISQLEELAAQNPAQAGTLAAATVTELSGAVRTGMLDELDELSLRVESYIFAGGEGLVSQLPSLRERLARLEIQNAGTHPVYAEKSGVFSSASDGYESVKPEMLEGLVPTTLQALFSGNAVSTVSAGKLITGITWYYASVMEVSDAARLEPGREITMLFTAPYRAYLQMRVMEIGRNENGNCVVIFSSNRNLAQTAPLREVRAEVVFGAVSGVRVPKESIHLTDEGKVLIYLETAGRFEAVYVNILSEMGDGYLIESAESANTALRPGAIVVVKANGLSEGGAAPR